MSTKRNARTGSTLTPTERVERLVSDAGGEIARAEVARQLAPILGVRRTRLAIRLAIAVRAVERDELDVLRSTR